MNFFQLLSTVVALLLSLVPSLASGEVVTLEQYIKRTCGSRKGCISARTLLEATAKATQATGVSQPMLIALAGAESSYDVVATNRESGVSVGLMQIQKSWHLKSFPLRNFYDPEQNILVGAGILRRCAIKHIGSDHQALMCYNGYSNKKYPAKILRRYHEVIGLREFKIQQASSE